MPAARRTIKSCLGPKTLNRLDPSIISLLGQGNTNCEKKHQQNERAQHKRSFLQFGNQKTLFFLANATRSTKSKIENANSWATVSASLWS
jgi:hypothetical protein